MNTKLVKLLQPMSESEDSEKITEQMVEDWIGDDATREVFIRILAEVANGEYRPQQLKADILEYWKQLIEILEGRNKHE